MRRVLKTAAAVVLAIVLALAALIAYWLVRPNTAVVDPSLDIETWVAVSDGEHNSNTDLIHWKGYYYLIHASSPWHFASNECHLVLHRSLDARNWAEVATFKIRKQDIRDPKLAVVGDMLFLYVLKNKDLNPEPYTTAYATSASGVKWSELRDVEPKGWLFWRPKTRDGCRWYVPAYWWQHGKSILLTSTDGRSWKEVSTIYEGDRNDETDFEFLPDGRILCTARLEVSEDVLGDKDAATLIAVAKPPYKEWKRIKSHVTRLDGPCLFADAGRIYAVGRHNPEPPGPGKYFGSILAKKRTALYEVTPDRLIHLSDLPSCGDTSYCGLVRRADDVIVSYYTNDVQTDPPWILGMISPSEIRMARIPLAFLRKTR
ncbi:MAG: exo-alpha-sialidase [Phycisphaerae bacterium]|nr:exo-alpha-sialidase [Phycisphaerae bacterium]